MSKHLPHNVNTYWLRSSTVRSFESKHRKMRGDPSGGWIRIVYHSKRYSFARR